MPATRDDLAAKAAGTAELVPRDPGLLSGAAADGALASTFLEVLALHHQFVRETDPPRV